MKNYTPPASYPVYLRSFLHFFRFAPKRILWLNFTSLFQGVIGSLGFLMLIPLAQLAGVDLSQYTSQHASFLNKVIEFVEQLGIGQSLGTVLLCYMGLTIVMACFTYHRSLMSARLQQQYVRQMRSHLYQTVLESDWSYLSGRRSSEYLHRIGAQVQSMNSSAYQIIGLLHKLLTMSVYSVLMMTIHWPFTVATFVVGIVVGLIVLPVRYSVRDTAERQLRGYREIFASLAEHLSSLKMIKESAREVQFYNVIADISTELEEQQVRVTRAGSIISFANIVGMALGFCILLYVAVTYLDVPLASFLILMIIMSRIMPQIAGLQQSVQGIVLSLPAFRDIEQVFMEAADAKEITVSNDVPKFVLRKGIELVNVGYHYPTQPDTPIFENLNLSINVNETVALSGISGIGKTTLADIIASLLRPSSGQFLVDGKELVGQHLLMWRRAIAYVTQNVYLFNDTIQNNLTWMAPDADEKSQWQALERAQLADRLASLPEKLLSHIGDRGLRFSGGERQRLALARALLTKPQLLILDEATSALDDDTEEKIHQVIRGLHGKLTVIIIAHRQSTLKLADRVVDVEALRYGSSSKQQ